MRKEKLKPETRMLLKRRREMVQRGTGKGNIDFVDPVVQSGRKMRERVYNTNMI